MKEPEKRYIERGMRKEVLKVVCMLKKIYILKEI